LSLEMNEENLVVFDTKEAGSGSFNLRFSLS